MTTLTQIPERIEGTLFVVSVLAVGSQTITYQSNVTTAKKIIEIDGQANIYQNKLQDNYICWTFPGYNGREYVKEDTSKLLVSEQKIYNLKKIEEIAQLKDDWNGNGAGAFDQKILDTVKNIIMFLDVQPEVFPTAYNTLQLEYDKEDGAHMEIEINSERQAEVYRIMPDTDEKTEQIELNVQNINKVVKQFYG